MVSLGRRLKEALSPAAGGRAAWDRVRCDDYALNPERKASLPKDVVGLLSELRKAKQRYILLRETDRYRRLLRSLPAWEPRPAARRVEAAQKSPKAVIPPKPKWKGPVVGIPGYSGANVAGKRYWFNEE